MLVVLNLDALVGRVVESVPIVLPSGLLVTPM